MFGKRGIQKHGRGAEAVVVNSDMSGYSNRHGINKYHLELRVKLDDGSTVDASCSAYPTGPMGAFVVGEIVPVRYDPKYPGDVEVDRDAMVAAAGADRNELKESAERLVRTSEERISKGRG